MPRLFAVSDLHLSGAVPTKAMDIFSPQWQDHAGKIERAWRERVGDNDVVLVAGDISWAMTMEEAQCDIDWIGALPGQKVMIKGNHDFWWGSIGRVRGMCNASMHILQNDCVTLDGIAFAGSRGWTCPGSANDTPQDRKIYQREALRLEMSLQAAEKTGLPIGAMMHYPPFNERQEDSAFTELFERYGVGRVIYGHLHGPATRYAFCGERNGVVYTLTSCDAVGFSPLLIGDLNEK